MADDVIRIEGLTEFRKALRAAQTDLPRALTEAHKKVARSVVTVAAPKLQTKYGKPARSTISASGTQSGAFIRLRGATAFGDEFGANRFRQFKPYLGRTGYAVYPTIRAQRAEIEADYLGAVDAAITKRAFPS